ncbi:ATP-binding cassette domain-containing protein [Paenibacillus mesophilus]|uniref:ABC transporter ATP-binding protein n=1 Tax=Paenibacillus mesophilus TaxID=2582849 RepID=UPI00110E7A9F|nr:oligopeptide/dipeptide ABC transporter ATP-binding protein [Paenibacillus mesophilus]TMV49107.1 ATP-binding cassette domain-containing protein [Paenibacillus mesophilus]
MTEALIRASSLAKHYPVSKQGLLAKRQVLRAVDGVSFRIAEGEIFGLVGESGCGKSTTGQLLVQLVKQTAGDIYYRGRNLSGLSGSEMKSLRRDIQIVFQDPYSSLNPKKTIGWILEEPLIIHRIGDKRTRRKIVAETLEQVGLDPGYASRYPHELSGGQRQRVGIAAALVLSPKFIVIDEAVSALDVSVQSQILNLLKQLQQKRGLTYLFISHDLNVVEYISDRVGVMYLGKMVEIFDAGAAGGEPLHPYTRALFSSVPDVKKRKERVMLQGEVPSPIDPPGGCAFHPRCPHAMDKCRDVAPELRIVGPGREVSCHLYEEANDTP